MSTWTLLVGIGTLIAAYFAVQGFYHSYRQRYYYLRCLYGRLCLLISEDQFVHSDDARFANVAYTLSAEKRQVTSALFLDDHVRTDTGILKRLEEMSLSLFPATPFRNLAISFALAMVLAPVLTFVLSVVPPLSDGLASEIKNGGAYELAMLMGAASLFSVAVTFGVIGCVVHAFVLRDLAEFLPEIQAAPVWSKTLGRRPAERTVILAKDDGAYAALSK